MPHSHSLHILYEVNVQMPTSVASDWLPWMIEHHIPDVLRTGLILDHCVYEVKNMQSSESTAQSACDLVEYSIQYYFHSEEDFKKYEKEFAPRLRSEHTARYHGRVSATRKIKKSFQGS